MVWISQFLTWTRHFHPYAVHSKFRSNKKYQKSRMLFILTSCYLFFLVEHARIISSISTTFTFIWNIPVASTFIVHSACGSLFYLNTYLIFLIQHFFWHHELKLSGNGSTITKFATLFSILLKVVNNLFIRYSYIFYIFVDWNILALLLFLLGQWSNMYNAK